MKTFKEYTYNKAIDKTIDLITTADKIRDYAKKSGGSDAQDFNTAADYLHAMGMLRDRAKIQNMKKKLSDHLKSLDTDVRDHILSMMK